MEPSVIQCTDSSAQLVTDAQILPILRFPVATFGDMSQLLNGPRRSNTSQLHGDQVSPIFVLNS